MKSELFADAGKPDEFPRDGLPEVAVIGRSNVGKSSFINALAGRRRLARTSSTPGKTRRIHFYRLDDRMYLVDLPGFGYAAVAKSERASWRPMVEGYLRGARQALRGVIVLVDVRRGPEREEIELLEWLDAERIAAKLVFTKSDKLKRSRLERAVRDGLEGIRVEPADVAAVSVTKSTGLATIVRWIEAWTGFGLKRPDGTPF